MPHDIPDRPWQKVGMDILTFGGSDYLLMVDYFSKFPELNILKSKTSGSIIQLMKSQFSRHGIPEIVVADNMPFGSQECKTFARQWNFEIHTSSPNFPQSNGLAERNVQTVKQLLRKSLAESKDPYIALLEFRNTPITGMKYTPAQMLMSRVLRSKLPCVNNVLEPKVASHVKEGLVNREVKQK